MGSKTRGVCLILNNQGYSESSALPKRAGSETDVENLRELFTKLEFLVTVSQDLNAPEMVRRLQGVASMDHTEYDCFVCFILSHGDESSLYCVDGSMVSVKTVVSAFHANKCISLAGKPKLFFIQASRGNEFPSGVFPATPNSGDEGVCAEGADFFVGFPSTESHFAFRNSTQGSWYINALIEVLSKHGDQFDLQTCMTMVTRMVASRVPRPRGLFGCKGVLCQIPQSVSTLRRPVFLGQSPVMTKPAPRFAVV